MVRSFEGTKTQQQQKKVLNGGETWQRFKQKKMAEQFKVGRMKERKDGGQAWARVIRSRERL